METRHICAVVLAGCALASCDNSNAFMGKWKSADRSERCREFITDIELTPNAMIMERSLTVAATYKKDGDRLIVTAPDGKGFTFVLESQGLKMVSPFECHFIAGKG